MQETLFPSLGQEDHLEYRIAAHSSILPEKAMAPHSSTLAWKIPWTEEPGGLQSMGSQRVRHDWRDLAAAAASILQCRRAGFHPLGWEDPLERRTATHSSILAWRIPWTIQPMGSQGVRHDWATFTFTFYFPHSCLEKSMDRGAWQATVHGVTKSLTQPSNQHTNTVHTIFS